VWGGRTRGGGRRPPEGGAIWELLFHI